MCVCIALDRLRAVAGDLGLAVRVVSPTVQALQAPAQPVLPRWGSVWLFWTLTDAVQQAAFASREMAVQIQQAMGVQVQ